VKQPSYKSARLGDDDKDPDVWDPPTPQRDKKKVVSNWGAKPRQAGQSNQP